MRVVLLSDTSKEFPNNTSSAFKVRLPEPGGWTVGSGNEFGVHAQRWFELGRLDQ